MDLPVASHTGYCDKRLLCCGREFEVRSVGQMVGLSGGQLDNRVVDRKVGFVKMLFIFAYVCSRA